MKNIARLAPSPTGLLHLGNAWSFMCAWLACRKTEGRMILRIEDIDPLRSTPQYAEQLMKDLLWLGIDWDEGPYRQSERAVGYERALTVLAGTGRVYRCYCTRRELRSMAGAPHVEDIGAPYPGTCRHLTEDERRQRERQGRKGALRYNTEGLPVYCFEDGVFGPQESALAVCGGDFPLKRSDGVWSYQLAVSVDDAAMGVTQVVRGADILVSTVRQLALFDALGYPAPTYAHLPLLCDMNGDRLAKRHTSLSLQALRDSGKTAEEVIGFLAYHGNLQPTAKPIPLASLVETFSFEKLPKTDIRCQL